VADFSTNPDADLPAADADRMNVDQLRKAWTTIGKVRLDAVNVTGSGAARPTIRGSCRAPPASRGSLLRWTLEQPGNGARERQTSEDFGLAVQTVEAQVAVL
jgi:hypothetical protein